MRHLNNGTDHRHSKSCCDQSSPARRTIICLIKQDNVIVASHLATQWAKASGMFVLWWRHQMETFSALLAICAGNSPVTGEFTAQRPVTRALMLSLIWAWINGWVNNREAGDLRRHRAHYDVIIMCISLAISWGLTHWPPRRFKRNFREVIFKLILVTDGWGVSYKIALRWMPLDLTDDKSTLVQLMAWCRQAPNDYLSQCWPRCMSPYGVTRPQSVNDALRIRGLFHDRFFHSNSNSMEISFFSYPHFSEAIAMKFYPRHDGCAVVAGVYFVAIWHLGLHYNRFSIIFELR